MCIIPAFSQKALTTDWPREGESKSTTMSAHWKDGKNSRDKNV